MQSRHLLRRTPPCTRDWPRCWSRAHTHPGGLKSRAALGSVLGKHVFQSPGNPHHVALQPGQVKSKESVTEKTIKERSQLDSKCFVWKPVLAILQAAAGKSRPGPCRAKWARASTAILAQVYEKNLIVCSPRARRGHYTNIFRHNGFCFGASTSIR